VGDVTATKAPAAKFGDCPRVNGLLTRRTRAQEAAEVSRPKNHSCSVSGMAN
jgi:hypothetical protein